MPLNKKKESLVMSNETVKTLWEILVALMQLFDWLISPTIEENIDWPVGFYEATHQTITH